MKKMKPLKALIIGLLCPIVFLASNFIVTYVSVIIYTNTDTSAAVYEREDMDSAANEQAEARLQYIRDVTPYISIAYGALTLLLFMIFFRVFKVRMASVVRWKPVGMRKAIPALLLGAFFALFVNGVFQLLPQEAISGQTTDYSGFFGSGAVMAIISMVIAAPIVEETVFRGLCFNYLRAAMPKAAAIIVQSALFALLHGEWINIVLVFFISLLITVVYDRCDSLKAAILLHMAYNLMTVILVYLPANTVASAVMTAIGGAASVALLVRLLRLTKTKAVKQAPAGGAG